MPLHQTQTIGRALEPIISASRLTAAPTLMNLYSRGRMFTKLNTTIDWVVDNGGATAAFETIGANGSNTNIDDVVNATLRIGQHRLKHQWTMSRVDMAEAALLAPEELADLFQAHVLRGITTIARRLNTVILTGDGTVGQGTVLGIHSQVSNLAAATTGSYAGITKVNGTEGASWRTIINHNGGVLRALTNDLLLDLDQVIRQAESYYDMIVCHPSVATKYAKLFVAIGQGFGLTPDEGSNGLTRVELGLGGRFYNGIAVIEDPQAPTSSVYFLNSADIRVHTFGLNVSGDDIANTTLLDPEAVYGLNVYLSELPSLNSSARTFELYCMPQLQLACLKSVAAIVDINPAL